jgi:CelD/BcsL family acetyltransferase involved in cellulose biosynthesis
VNNVIIATSLPEIEKLQAAWETLYASTRDATMFQSYEWNRLAAQIFKEREHPFVVYAKAARGRALIPACISKETAKFLGDELFDYPDVLAEGDLGALKAAWQEIARLSVPFRLHGVRTSSPLQKLLSQAVVPFSAAPGVPATISAQEFEQEHTRSGRLVRRLRRLGVQLRRAVAEPFLVRKIYQLKAAQNEDGRNLFQDPKRVGFMTFAAQGKAAHCEIFMFEKESEIVAAIVTFRDRAIRRFYTAYYDQAWARWSPGAALLFEATRLSLEERLACDYMTGEQTYKLRLAGNRVPLLKIEVETEAAAESTAELSLAG